MTLSLHAHPLSSYCWKALIALYEKEAVFEFALVDFGNEANAAAFRALWPIAKMPVLVDDGRPLFESSVIVEYVDRREPGATRLVPDDPEAALEVRMMDRIFDNYVMTPMQRIIADRLRPADRRDPTGVSDARQMLRTSYGWLEQRMAGREWAAGDSFSLADCAAAPSLHYGDKVEPLRQDFPALGAYLARLEARPSFARVLEEAAPYAHFFPQDPEQK